MSKELELIAGAVLEAGNRNVRGGLYDHEADAIAAHVVSVLAASGHTIIQLPKASVNSSDNAYWETRTHYIEQEFSGEVIVNDRIGVDVSELRAVAAALLAAAASAEEETND